MPGNLYYVRLQGDWMIQMAGLLEGTGCLSEVIGQKTMLGVLGMGAW